MAHRLILPSHHTWGDTTPHTPSTAEHPPHNSGPGTPRSYQACPILPEWSAPPHLGEVQGGLLPCRWQLGGSPQSTGAGQSSTSGSCTYHTCEPCPAAPQPRYQAASARNVGITAPSCAARPSRRLQTPASTSGLPLPQLPSPWHCGPAASPQLPSPPCHPSSPAPLPNLPPPATQAPPCNPTQVSLRNLPS